MRALVVVLVLTSIATAQPAELTREFQAGVDAFRLGKLADAKRHLERARELDPRLPGPHRFLAAVAGAEEDWAACIRHARAAIAANPRSAELADTRKLHDRCRAADGRPAFEGALDDGAAIAVSAGVAGASVVVDGLAIGGTPLAPRKLPPGDHVVELAKAGFEPATVRITALPGIVTDVEVTLAPLPDPGTPAVIAQATGALVVRGRGSVTIDGKPTDGEAGARELRRDLPPGTHVVDVRAPAHDPWRRRVRIQVGTTRTVEPVLVETAGREARRRRGWLWVGAGATVLAAGGACAVLGATRDERGPWLTAAGVAGLTGTAITVAGIFRVMRNAPPDLTAPPAFAVVPVDGGAIAATAGVF